MTLRNFIVIISGQVLLSTKSHSSWRNVVGDLASVYYDTPTDEERHHVKKDDSVSTKYIAILVLVCFLTFVIVSSLLIVCCKWLATKRNRKDGNDEAPQKRDHDAVDARDVTPPAAHVRLMRSDSSLSEVSRDTSRPLTPMSPLSEEDPTPFSFERGRLEFSVIYESENECLKTTVIQGHGLPQRHCIFFVEVLLLPDRSTKQKTSIRYHNPSPIFEETFGFYLPHSELAERTLCMRVYELDGFSQQKVVGHVLYSFQVENGNYINPLKMNMELCHGRLQDVTEEDPVGEVLMSLCYLPTAGRLTMVILKCRLFKASLNNGVPSPFLKVSLMLNRKQVKKIKTSVKLKTLNPVYNEAFIFDVPAQHVSNVNLYARVVNDREDQQVMGKIIIGPNAKSIMGIHHWECMLLSPRKPIAQWHMMK